MFRKNKVMLVCLGGICLLALSGCGDTENPLFNQKVFTVEKVAVGESSPDDTLNSFGTITGIVNIRSVPKCTKFI